MARWLMWIVLVVVVFMAVCIVTPSTNKVRFVLWLDSEIQGWGKIAWSLPLGMDAHYITVNTTERESLFYNYYTLRGPDGRDYPFRGRGYVFEPLWAPDADFVNQSRDYYMKKINGQWIRPQL